MSDDNTTNPILFPILTPIKGTCFVTGCKNSGLAVKISHDDACIHVMACVNPTDLAVVESEPFTLKHSVLNSMSISSEWKHTIWLKVRRYYYFPKTRQISIFSSLDHTFPVHFFYQLYMQETGNLNME